LRCCSHLTRVLTSRGKRSLWTAGSCFLGFKFF
jgi:hypothetical protein